MKNYRYFFEGINAEGSFDYKNGNHAPPEEQRQGTLNEQLSYWKGQKRRISKEKHIEQSLLENAAFQLATVEIDKYKAIGKPSKSKAYNEIKSYFNGSANKIAYISLLYTSYYDKKLLKKTIVSSKLEITHKAAGDMVNECVNKGYVMNVNAREHQASPYLIEAYLDYVKEQIQYLLPQLNKLSSMFNATKLSHDVKIDDIR
tara:strand:- start:115 stop:720 length:606 start_codon:yes stop_codon:yes gene_type:complete